MWNQGQEAEMTSNSRRTWKEMTTLIIELDFTKFGVDWTRSWTMLCWIYTWFKSPSSHTESHKHKQISKVREYVLFGSQNLTRLAGWVCASWTCCKERYKRHRNLLTTGQRHLCPYYLPASSVCAGTLCPIPEGKISGERKNVSLTTWYFSIEWKSLILQCIDPPDDVLKEVLLRCTQLKYTQKEKLAFLRSEYNLTIGWVGACSMNHYWLLLILCLRLQKNDFVPNREALGNPHSSATTAQQRRYWSSCNWSYPQGHGSRNRS